MPCRRIIRKREDRRSSLCPLVTRHFGFRRCRRAVSDIVFMMPASYGSSLPRRPLHHLGQRSPLGRKDFRARIRS
ncbi:hypothetical protein CALVIDRAFT_56915 [Calocera viscosa TUFC12733]|uniref:Uncharacterized protein n=1 Tax=Calocera viscosa (strain TUFC12733) TaxID=1330018 RepID=A0A167FID9_CALVF|nr:hypothetical protein CALVIDRAFT_56915 [Calocera viscosa TUFC12733]